MATLLVQPTTRLCNKTDEVMVVVTVDEYRNKLSETEKRIERGGYADLDYSEGIYRKGPRIYYLVYPDQNGCAPPKKILPIDIYNFADTDITYKLLDGSVARSYQLGAVLHFHFKSSEKNTFSRIGFARYANSIITAIFGNCCSATHVPTHATHVPTHATHVPTHATPTPVSEIELGIN